MLTPRWDWPKQTCLRENGEVGDCWRCCIAAILQVRAEAVPHFVRDCRSPDADAQRWLNARGFTLAQANRVRLRFPRWAGDGDAMLVPIIASGPTVRSRTAGDWHSVVMRGDEVLYDPHPSNAGLLEVMEEEIIVPRYPWANDFLARSD